MLKLKVSRIGNSGVIFIPKPVLDLLGWEVGTELEAEKVDDKLVLRRMNDGTTHTN